MLHFVTELKHIICVTMATCSFGTKAKMFCVLMQDDDDVRHHIQRMKMIIKIPIRFVIANC